MVCSRPLWSAKRQLRAATLLRQPMSKPLLPKEWKLRPRKSRQSSNPLFQLLWLHCRNKSPHCLKANLASLNYNSDMQRKSKHCKIN
jgi:hypothetical protein